MGLFTRRANGPGKLRKRLDSDMRDLKFVAANYGGAAADCSFDLAGFAVRAFELAPTEDIDYLVTHGIDGGEFFLRELKPNWADCTREQRAAKIASFVRFANLLSRNEDDGLADGAADDAEPERLAELRATVRTKIVLLASAYDCEYDDSYCRRIARNLHRFGDYELAHA